MKAIIKNEKVLIFEQLPTIWVLENGNILNNFHNCTEEQLDLLGFKNIEKPELLDGQKYVADLEVSDFDEEKNLFVWRVVEVPTLTDFEVVKLALEKETEKYIQRTQDGIETYASLSAEFRLAKLNGVLSEDSQKSIERALIPVRNEVLAGQWISALEMLEEIGSSVIGEDLYNRLNVMLNDYITKNYE